LPKNEIEAKVLEVDKEKLSEKIEELGAEKKFESSMRSEFFDFPDSRIEKDGILRLRTRDGEAFITRKREVAYDDAKEMEEIEFDVSDPEETREFLRSLGLERIAESEKTRAKWVKGDTEFVIDKFSGIPHFLEIEAPDREKLMESFEALGFSQDETVNWGGKKVFEHYGKL
jgi:adenylate cyclase class 2